MRNTLVRIGFVVVVLSVTCASAFAQGRGRGHWQEKRRDVFFNGFDAHGRGHNQNWKCGVFVNCHDARDGRLDGRGPRVNRNNFFSRGDRIGWRRRYNMNDYWNRRHATYVNNDWRYRNRTWRYR